MEKIWIHSSTKVAIYAVVFLALYVMPGSGKCTKPDEVEICFKDLLKGCFCEACISCKAGYGPSHQCGGRYMNGTIITCKPCISGVSYSEEYSITSCHPCNQCGGRETLQKCTPKSETSCSTKCRVGYIMSHAVDQCLPDPSFTTTSPQINTAKLTAGTHLPKTTTIPKTTTDITTTQVGNTQRETHGSINPFHPDASGSNSANNHSKDNKIINLIILSVFGIAVLIFVGYCVLKKKQVACFRRDNAMNQNPEEIRLTDKDSTSPRSSQEIVPWPENLCLKDIKLALRSDITNHISENSTVVKGWRAIGEKRELSTNDLQAIRVEGQKQGTTQGEQLLMKLESCQPELTLMEFVNTLEILGRKDVVDLIKDHYNNENRINSAIIQITPQDPQNDQLDE